MKLNKKKILVLALALSLLALISAGTLAWFTDSDSVTNNFHVATSTQEPDDIFSVTLLENVDADGDGYADTVVGGYSFENIYPGAQLVKEPFVTNTGSYDQYIRVLVTIDADYDALVGKNLTGTLLGMDSALWTVGGRVENGNQVTYTYYLNTILAPNASQTLFTHVEIPANLEQADFATISAGDFQMIIEAQAVQADNTGDNAIEAFKLVG